MEKSDSLYSPDGIRSLTMRTAIELLWTTGLRTSEPVNLKTSDVDLDNSIITIQHSKFNKDRILPILPTVTNHLRLYRNKVDVMTRLPIQTDSYFVTTNDTALKANALQYAFKK